MIPISYAKLQTKLFPELEMTLGPILLHMCLSFRLFHHLSHEWEKRIPQSSMLAAYSLHGTRNLSDAIILKFGRRVNSSLKQWRERERETHYKEIFWSRGPISSAANHSSFMSLPRKSVPKHACTMCEYYANVNSSPIYNSHWTMVLDRTTCINHSRPIHTSGWQYIAAVFKIKLKLIAK